MKNENSQKNKVYNFVIEQIKCGVWKPGDKIFTEKELSEKLETSRIAVREGLGECSTLGILEKKRGSGTFVADIDISKILKNIIPLMTLTRVDIMEVLKFRLYFEPGNVREFMKYCTAKDVDQLETVYQKMKECDEASSDFYLYDYQFHDIIARGTRNHVVAMISEMLTEILSTSQEITNLKIGPDIGLRFHKEIMKAIENHDVQMASLLMQRHIEATIRGIELAGQPEDEETENNASMKFIGGEAFVTNLES